MEVILEVERCFSSPCGQGSVNGRGMSRAGVMGDDESLHIRDKKQHEQ